MHAASLGGGFSASRRSRSNAGRARRRSSRRRVNPSEPDAGGAGGESGTPSDAGATERRRSRWASDGGASDGGASDGGGGGPSSFIDGDLEGPLPKRLSELGLYPEPKTRSSFHARAVYYEPRYPLWSNGSEKQRFIVSPRDLGRHCGLELGFRWGPRSSRRSRIPTASASRAIEDTR